MKECSKPDFIVENLDRYKYADINYFFFDIEKSLKEINFKVHSWGKIDWSNKNSCSLDAYQDEIIEPIIEYLKRHINEKAMITWSEYYKCSIEVDVNFIIDNLEDIIYEDFDFWIISLDKTWVIEYYHEGELTFFPCLSNKKRSIYDNSKK